MSRKDATELLRLATRLGCEYLGVNGRDHHVIRLPNGETTVLSGTPSHLNRQAYERELYAAMGIAPKVGKRRLAASRRREAEAQRRLAGARRVTAHAKDAAWREHHDAEIRLSERERELQKIDRLMRSVPS